MWKINHFFTSLCPKSVENTLHKISKVLFYSRGWSYLFLPYLYSCLGFKLNDPDTYGSYKKYFRFFTNFRDWNFPLLPYLFLHFFMLSMKEAWVILNIDALDNKDLKQEDGCQKILDTMMVGGLAVGCQRIRKHVRKFFVSFQAS